MIRLVSPGMPQVHGGTGQVKFVGKVRGGVCVGLRLYYTGLFGCWGVGEGNSATCKVIAALTWRE